MNFYKMAVWLHHFPDHTFTRVHELTEQQEELVNALDEAAGRARNYCVEGVGLREVKGDTVNYYIRG